MIILKCSHCKCEIEVSEEFEEMYYNMGEPDMMCDDCVDGIMNTQEDRAYDEWRGK